MFIQSEVFQMFLSYLISTEKKEKEKEAKVVAQKECGDTEWFLQAEFTF